MENAHPILNDLVVLLLTAALAGYAFVRLRVPPVLGYLAIGFLVGPGALGWVTATEFIQILGELGVVLLMFGLGLDFELGRLRRTATFSVVAGVASVVLTFVAVNAVMLLLGRPPLEALFLAAGLSICGTAVNLRLLSEMGHLKTDYGAGITATIVVTDIAAVLLLTALSGVALGGGLDAGALSLSLVSAAAFLVFAPAAGFLLVPRLLNWVARDTRSREILLLATLGLCFGLALVSQKLGFSVALGAFLMGMVVSEARVYHPIEEMVKPLEHIFATLFFLSMGLSVRLAEVVPYVGLGAVLLALVVATRLVSVPSVAYLVGRPGRQALIAGWALVPIGEFTLVIAHEGVRFGVLSMGHLSTIVLLVFLTALLAAGGLRSVDRTLERLTEWLPAGVLNLFTLVQLRTAGTRAVPGLADALERAGVSAEEPEPSGKQISVKGEVFDIGLNAVLVVTITLGLVGLAKLLDPMLPEWLDVRLGALAAAALLCAPSIVFIFKSGADLAGLVSRRLAARFPAVEPGVTRGALLAASTFFLFLFLQAAFLPLVVLEFRDHGQRVLLIAGAATLLLGYLAWRALARFQAGITNLVRSTLTSAALGKRTTARPARPADRGPHAGADHPGLYRAMIEHIPVPAGSALVERTIGDSGLREHSGVSVLAIERDGRWIANPPADERIRAGDELVVIGSEEQREEAERYVLPAPAGRAGV
jgi:CPA2 family monovalent cation:H+ antiporter-2